MVGVPGAERHGGRDAWRAGDSRVGWHAGPFRTARTQAGRDFSTDLRCRPQTARFAACLFGERRQKALPPEQRSQP